MANSDASNSENSKRKHFYVWIHFPLEFVFFLVLVYLFICELNIIDNSLFNINEGPIYEAIDGWFKDDLSVSTGNTSIDYVINNIIVILLPFIVTILTISFSLISETIYGVKYSKFRQLGVNRTYRFVWMVMISVILFVLDIVFYYFEFILCTLALNVIALVYIVFFCFLEIPLLSQDQRRLNRLLRKCIDHEYVKEDNFVDDTILRKVLATFVEEEGIKKAYESVRYKEKKDKYKEKNNKHKDYQRICLEILMNEYTGNLLDNIYPETLSNEDVYRCLKTFEEYFNVWGNANKSKDNINNLVRVDAQILNRFIKMLDFDTTFGQSAFQHILSMLIHQHIEELPQVAFQIIKDYKIDLWTYDSSDLFKYGILNTLLINSLNTCSFSVSKQFINAYLIGENNNPTSSDTNYFVFISIYMYYLRNVNGISTDYIDFYDDIFRNDKCTPLLKYGLYYKSQNGKQTTDAFLAVVLLKRLLEICKITDDGPARDGNSWYVMPIGFNGKQYLPFSHLEIFNWWITFLFASNIANASTIEVYFHTMINESNRREFLQQFSFKWRDQNTKKFMPYYDYAKYFNDLGISIDFNSESNRNLVTILEKLCADEVVQDASMPKDNNISDNQMGNKDFSKALKTIKKKYKEFIEVDGEEMPLSKIPSRLKKDINYCAKEFEFYSSDKKRAQEKCSSIRIPFYFSINKYDGSPIGTISDLIKYSFDKDGYKNYFASYLSKNFKVHNEEYSLHKSIDSYNEDIANEVIQFNPKKKFAHNISSYIWSNTKTAINFNEIGSIEDIHSPIELVNDTFLQEDAIKFYIKCKKVTKPLPLTDNDITRFINQNSSPFKKNSDGSFAYRYNHADVFLSEEQLHGILKDNLYYVYIVFDFEITYDKNKILVIKCKK